MRTAGKLVVFLGAILRAAGRKHDNPAADVSRPEPNAEPAASIGMNSPLC